MCKLRPKGDAWTRAQGRTPVFGEEEQSTKGLRVFPHETGVVDVEGDVILISKVEEDGAAVALRILDETRCVCHMPACMRGRLNSRCTLSDNTGRSKIAPASKERGLRFPRWQCAMMD